MVVERRNLQLWIQKLLDKRTNQIGLGKVGYLVPTKLEVLNYVLDTLGESIEPIEEVLVELLRIRPITANLKDQARENVNRGVIRVMGLVNTGLFVALAVTSLNLRLSEKWSRDSAPGPVKKTGRPRKVGVAAYARAFAVATTGPSAS